MKRTPLIITENTYKILKEITNQPNQSQTQISKNTNITFSQINRILKELQAKKLITITKKGRTSLNNPTPSANEIIDKIDHIRKELKLEKV